MKKIDFEIFKEFANNEKLKSIFGYKFESIKWENFASFKELEFNNDKLKEIEKINEYNRTYNIGDNDIKDIYDNLIKANRFETFLAILNHNEFNATFEFIFKNTPKGQELLIIFKESQRTLLCKEIKEKKVEIFSKEKQLDELEKKWRF